MDMPPKESLFAPHGTGWDSAAGWECVVPQESHSWAFRSIPRRLAAPRSSSRPGLTAGAEVGRAVHERYPDDRGSAPGARLPLLPVHLQRPVEVAALTVHVHIQGGEGRASLRE